MFNAAKVLNERPELSRPSRSEVLVGAVSTIALWILLFLGLKGDIPALIVVSAALVSMIVWIGLHVNALDRPKVTMLDTALMAIPIIVSLFSFIDGVPTGVGVSITFSTVSAACYAAYFARMWRR